MELFPKGMVLEAGEGVEVVVVVWREGSEEERGRRRGAANFQEPFWCSSGAFPRPLISPFGDLCQRSPVARSALRTTITGKDGDDSQRVHRVIQACGTHRHYCYVWI